MSRSVAAAQIEWRNCRRSPEELGRYLRVVARVPVECLLFLDESGGVDAPFPKASNYSLV